MEVNDREARIHLRRQRIDACKASNSDTSLKNQLHVGESKRTSRGKQQVANSLLHLDRLKLAGICHVTSVRVNMNNAENRRRVEEEERRHKRVEKLQQEAIESGPKNAAVEMKWADLFEFSMPKELHDELELQSHACIEILASKDTVICEFRNQLKVKDEEFVAALKVQAGDVQNLVDRMGQQYREMHKEYELEQAQMEEAFFIERNELIVSNKHEIDSLYKRRRETELGYMEAKQLRNEQYLQEIEDLRVHNAEAYNELKKRLDTNIQKLEQQLEEMRAAYQLNTEKLEYNYRVLTERGMENSATLNQQKRKLTRLKDALSTLIVNYNQIVARDQQTNRELTEEYRRLTKQYCDLQQKDAHFETSDSNKFDEVWQMHEEEAMRKIEKLLDADRIIHEQQLNLTWRPPAQSIQSWSHSVKGGDKAVLIKRLENRLPVAINGDKKRDKNGGNADRNQFDDELVEGYTPQAKKISGAKLKYMLEILASEAQFLVNGSVQQALDKLPDDEAELVEADMIMRTLCVDNEVDMEKLMGRFFDKPREEELMDLHGENNNKDDRSPSKDDASWGLVVGPQDVIRVVKQFVEEMNIQKRAIPANRILQQSSNRESVVAKNSGERNSTKDLEIEAREAEKEYWLDLVEVFSAQKIRILETLEKGLIHYNTALLRRKELIGDVTALSTQNAELKNLLKQYLAAPINEKLIVPPTHMLLYQ